VSAAIVSVYREQPALLDYEVDKALDALIRAYQAEQQQRPRVAPVLPALPQTIYERVREMCEWRLGRENPFKAEAGGEVPQPEPYTLAEIVACLKRIRKSVQKWSKREGRQGYVRFITEFI
jgi:hypothetical protein